MLKVLSWENYNWLFLFDFISISSIILYLDSLANMHSAHQWIYPQRSYPYNEQLKLVGLFCFKLLILNCLLQCYNIDQIWQISKISLLSISSTSSMPKKLTTYHLHVLCIMASFLEFDKRVTILLLDLLGNMVFFMVI